jgi:hypothetical protein
MEFDRTKTLVQLKREKFRDPAWDFLPFASGYALRHKPIHELRTVELWILIRQGIGLDYLVLLALERLEVEPLLKCRHTEGDLLSAVLWADALVWKRNPHYRDRVTKIWRKVSGRLMAHEHPMARMLFSDYRWFLKSDKFLPKD